GKVAWGTASDCSYFEWLAHASRTYAAAQMVGGRTRTGSLAALIGVRAVLVGAACGGGNTRSVTQLEPAAAFALVARARRVHRTFCRRAASARRDALVAAGLERGVALDAAGRSVTSRLPAGRHVAGGAGRATCVHARVGSACATAIVRHWRALGCARA